MRTISKIFFAGLATVLPLALTVWLLYWAGTRAEKLFGEWFRQLMPEGWYQPGLGVIAMLVAIFLVGLLTRALLIRRVLNLGERLVNHIPLVKTLYGALRDLTSFVSGDRQQQFSRVVAVSLPGLEMDLIGFVTREDLSALPAPAAGADKVAVYLPLSYQIGGYTVLIPKNRLQPLDMSMESAMRFTVTAGMSGPRETPK